MKVLKKCYFDIKRVFRLTHCGFDGLYSTFKCKKIWPRVEEWQMLPFPQSGVWCPQIWLCAFRTIDCCLAGGDIGKDDRKRQNSAYAKTVSEPIFALFPLAAFVHHTKNAMFFLVHRLIPNPRLAAIPEPAYTLYSSVSQDQVEHIC